MAKFRQGNLVLQESQKIIQGGVDILSANGAADFTALVVSGSSEFASVDISSDLDVGGTLDVVGATFLSTLELAAGTIINEFSTDGTLAGDSDNAVPTEKAIKTYVDAQIGGTVPVGVDEAVVRYNGVNSVQDSGVFIDDSNNLTGVNNIDSTGDITCNDLYVSGDTIFVGTGEIKSTSGNIELSYGGSTVLSTQVGGVRVYDNSGSDPRIDFLSDGGLSMGVIQTAVSGNLYLDAGSENSDKDVYLRTHNGSSNEQMVWAEGGGGVHLFFDGGEVLQTITTGIQAASSVTAFDIKTSGGEDGITINNDGSVELFHNNVIRLATESTGISVNGDVTIGGNTILNSIGETAIELKANAAVEFYYDNVKVGETTVNGITGAVWG